MGWSIRTLLIWLLVLAVPAQGAAAATMALCGPNHHAAGAGAAMVHAQAGGLSSASPHDLPHDRPQAHSHDHAQHSAATPAARDHDHAVAVAPFAGEASVPAQGMHAGQHKCSACASCCSVSAMLSPVLAVPVPDFAPTVFTAVVPSVEAFSSDSPDRPPRIVLA